MSGPKDLDWYLEMELEQKRQEERLLQLQKEQQERLEQQQRQQLKDNIAQTINQIESSLNLQNSHNEHVLNQVKDFNYNLQLVEKINEETLSLNDYVQKHLQQNYNDTIESLENYFNQLVNVQHTLNQHIQTITQLNEELVKDTQNNATVNIIHKLNQTTHDFTITVTNDEFINVVSEFNQLFNQCVSSAPSEEQSLLHTKKLEVDELLSNEMLSEDYKINQIKLLIKDLYAKQHEYDINQQLLQQYQQHYVMYQLLCEKLHREVTLNKYPLKSNLNTSLEQLTTTITQYKRQLQEQEDYDYIVSSINEVMEEMGYDIIHSEVLSKVNRNIVDHIYSFNNDSVLNVFTSDNGTIMFEVTGISNEKKEMSSLEKLKIKESMDEFCGQYDQIKQKLAQRGIRFGRENIKPADEKYARVRVVSKEKYDINQRQKNSLKNFIKKSEYFK